MQPFAAHDVRTPEEMPAPPSLSDEKLAHRRAAAELDAARARVERDKARAIADARIALVTDLLPVLDNIDRSIDASTGDPAARQGMLLVRAQLETVLQGYGLERFDA